MAMPRAKRRYVYAGWDVRAVAGMVDLLAVSLLMGGVLYVVQKQVGSSQQAVGLVALCGFPAILFAYFVCAEVLTGTTLGKRLFRMTVVCADSAKHSRPITYDQRIACEKPEGRIAWSQALVRNIPKVMLLLPIYAEVGETISRATATSRTWVAGTVYGASLSNKMDSILLVAFGCAVIGSVVTAVLINQSAKAQRLGDVGAHTVVLRPWLADRLRPFQ